MFSVLQSFSGGQLRHILSPKPCKAIHVPKGATTDDTQQRWSGWWELHKAGRNRGKDPALCIFIMKRK